jgi:hypothetical protein
MYSDCTVRSSRMSRPRCSRWAGSRRDRNRYLLQSTCPEWEIHHNRNCCCSTLPDRVPRPDTRTRRDCTPPRQDRQADPAPRRFLRGRASRCRSIFRNPENNWNNSLPFRMFHYRTFLQEVCNSNQWLLRGKRRRHCKFHRERRSLPEWCILPGDRHRHIRRVARGRGYFPPSVARR